MDYANNKNSYQQKSNVIKAKGFSFYQKIFFLYFLNLVDWFCTEALIASGRFFEANPIMQPVIDNFWLTLMLKGLLPLVLVVGCCVIYKLLGVEEGFLSRLLLNIGICAYALVNLWHIFNFVLLFFFF